MTKPKLLLFVDLQSPFAYLTLKYIRTSELFKACDVSYMPILLIGLVKAGVATPPWGNKNKVSYMERDLSRWTKQLKIPFLQGWPPNYPQARTSEVQRVIAACTIECPDQVGDVLDALFHAFWAEHQGVQAIEVFEPILQHILGPSMADKIVTLSHSEETKQLLRQNTQDAISSGVCGLPWLVATNSAGEKDVFWGFDHLGQVATFLGLGWLPSPHM